MKEPKKGEISHSVTIYRSSVGLPSLMMLERTGTSGLHWEPVISHRIQEHCEIVYVLGGSGRIAVQDRWCDAREHQVFFIAPKVPLDLITQDDGSKLDLLYAHFHMQNDHHFRRITGPAYYIVQEIDSYDDEAYLNMLALPDQLVLPPDNAVLRYLMAALEVYDAKNPGYYQQACGLLLGALHQLAGALLSVVSQPASGARGAAAALARRVRSYITARVKVFSGMKELGEAFRMNSQHLSRVFKRVYGENIVSFTNRIRVEIAKRILVNSDRSMPDVASASGFKTTNHFQRVFRQDVGLSPLEFRSHRSAKSTPAIGFTTPLDRIIPGKEET